MAAQIAPIPVAMPPKAMTNVRNVSIVNSLLVLLPRSPACEKGEPLSTCFRFLKCPGDFLRVGVGGQHAKSLRSLHRPKSPPLVCTRGGRIGKAGRVGASPWPLFEQMGGERLHPV